ncbi:MAG: hypothetical protein R8G01_20120 [Ilumatobacteraceae bacterium]|nr:hypothetical protein [Ilumatobacteraceae bacterium]
MTRPAAGALALVAVLTLGACGTTFVDESVTTVDTSPDATTTTLAPVEDDAPIGELLTDIERLMFDLDQRIIDDDDAVETLDRLDELWRVAERQIRAEDPDDLFNFQQAIELARTGVERRRPADASKGYKILADVNDAYLGRS